MAGKAEHVNARATVLVVIDVQQGFLNRHSAGVVPTIVRLVEAWRAAGAPIVLSRFRNPPGSPYETITGWTRLRTPEEQAFAPQLTPYVDGAAAVIEKTQASIFTLEATDLFRRAGWRDLVLCGIDTDACVYDTAVAAYHGGFRPWIVTDACASSGGTQYHDAALLLAARNIGAAQLVTSTAALAQIGGPEGACV